MKQVLQQQYKITSILCINRFLLLNTFSFLFLQTSLFSLFINSISLFFDLFEPCTALNFLLPCHLVSEFLFFVLFRMLRMLVTVSKAKFSLRRTLITFSKIPSECWLPCIRLSLHHENIDNVFMLT